MAPLVDLFDEMVLRCSLCGERFEGGDSYYAQAAHTGLTRNSAGETFFLTILCRPCAALSEKSSAEPVGWTLH